LVFIYKICIPREVIPYNESAKALQVCDQDSIGKPTEARRGAMIQKPAPHPPGNRDHLLVRQIDYGRTDTKY
jgi:hypothetical protein